MPIFLLKRLAALTLTLMVASVLVFAVLELLPGNAAQVILGDSATPESLAALEAQLGLDRPQPPMALLVPGTGAFEPPFELGPAGARPLHLLAQRLHPPGPLKARALGTGAGGASGGAPSWGRSGWS